MIGFLKKIWLLCLLGSISLLLFSQEVNSTIEEIPEPGNEQFLDSLKTKAYKRGFTRFLYKNLVKEDNEVQENLDEQYQYMLGLNGKTIASIDMKALQVFGPTFSDPEKRSESQLARWANKLHTKTNLKIIRKNILLNTGDIFDADQTLDNERIIRALPYIRDVRFFVSENPGNPNMVDILVLTKDVFSFGMDAKIRGVRSAELEMYNQNIWGQGHQISARMVGHADKEPFVGFEGFYTINNINGNFIDFSVGYSNTYRKEGFSVGFEKQFISSATKLGGGATFARLTRADRLLEDDPVETEFPLDYSYFDLWAGYAFQLNKNEADRNMQLVLSGRLSRYDFLDRPPNDPQDNQYFASSNFYLASLTLSKRNYIRDYLVYSYGITEDIPRGYMHELVIGYDKNEFGNRWYSHLYFSSGNFIKYKPQYLYASLGIGGFFNSMRFQQGLIQANGNYVSRIFRVGNQRARQFINLNYVLGIRRFELENLYLRNGIGIRGFESDLALGKQRLSLNLETVFFQNREIMKFNIALFGFADLGVIGSNHKIIFNQDYYSGIGAGIRLRNENLVIRTIQFRLAYYPAHPPDIGGLGILLTERNKSDFYSFQPRKPEPLRFE